MAGGLQFGERHPGCVDMLAVGIEIQEGAVSCGRILFLDRRPREFFRAFELGDPVGDLSDVRAGGKFFGKAAERRDLVVARTKVQATRSASASASAAASVASPFG